MVKRASALSIGTSDLAEHYGGTKAGPTQIKVAFDARRLALTDSVELEVLDKVAAAAHQMDGEDVAACLTELDHALGLDAHWGGDIPDPYYSAFSKTAGKQESEVAPDESIIVGNEYVTQRKLVEFAKMRQENMKERFGDDMALEFLAEARGRSPKDHEVLWQLGSLLEARKNKSHAAARYREFRRSLELQGKTDDKRFAEAQLKINKLDSLIARYQKLKQKKDLIPGWMRKLEKSKVKKMVFQKHKLKPELKH